MKDLIEGQIRSGNIKKAISIFLKWEIIDGEARKELTLQLSRYNKVNYDFVKGLTKEEDFRITVNRITEFTLDLLLEVERKYKGTTLKNLPKSILVAGTGNLNPSSKEILAAKELGKFLGLGNYILISGGWKGVDYYVTHEFSKIVGLKDKKNLYKRLFQIVSKNKEPKIESGNVFYVNQGLDEWTRALNLADYVIIIGGAGGTLSTYINARHEGIPVFPLFDTEGDTNEVKIDLINNWPNTIYNGINKNEFMVGLSREIYDSNDTNELFKSIEEYINKIEKSSDNNK